MPTPLRTAHVQSSYAVYMPVDLFTAFEHHQEEMAPGTGLLHDLEALPGVSGVDWNGHFGPCVLYAVEADRDSAATREEVERLIRAAIDAAIR